MADPQQTAQDLLSRRLVLVTGKGGVGKTSVAAALALAAARAGKRPLLVTCDGRPTLGRILGGADEGPEATDLGRGVHGLRVDFSAALVDLIGDMLGARRMVEVFLGNKVVRTFVNAAPSVLEMTLLHRVEKARGAEKGGPYQPIIVDLPASGHALALLSTPRAVMRMVRVGPLFRRAVELLRMVGDSRNTALCVVTLAEELPVNETIELVGRARGLGVPTGHVVVNAVPHAPLSEADVAALTRLKDEAADPVRSWADEALTGTHKGSRAEAEIARLEGAASSAVVRVPFHTENGPRLADKISERFHRG